MLGRQQTPPTGTLGERIRAVRTALSLPLRDTANKIGISRTSLGQWEADAVKNPDTTRLKEFAALTEINLDWLIAGRGEPPAFLTQRRRRARGGAATEVMGDNAMPERPLSQQSIPEVAPSLTAHAAAIDITPRAWWSIPQEVLELGFNAMPSSTVVKRVMTLDGDAFGLERGDYVLIDGSRTRINEPGLYLLADPEGKCAMRALVDDKLRIARIGDDTLRGQPQIDADKITVLGRVMGIFKPI